MNPAVTVAVLSWSIACTPNAKEAASPPPPAASAPATLMPSTSAPKSATDAVGQPQGAPAVTSTTPDATADYPVRWSEQLGLRSLSELPNQLSRVSSFYGELSRGDHVEMPKSCADWARLHAEGYEPSVCASRRRVATGS
jgi:hypothetical protein